MTGHWEFTYTQPEVLRNIAKFKGEFLAQNMRIKEDSLFGDNYRAMVDQHNGIGLFDEDNALPFKPYTIRTLNGQRIAIIGQAFPRTANANPRANFPDWSFGLREESLQKSVDQFITQIRQTKYSESIIESRNPKYAVNQARLGKTYESILNEELAIAP